MALTVVDHPLARHLLTHLRDRTTKPALFRTIAAHLTTLLAVEATRDFPTVAKPIETPLESIDSDVLDGGMVIVSILRAGLSMCDPILDLFPDVSVGYIGLERDEETAEARCYYGKLPKLVGKPILVVDPMLATGGSACQAIQRVKDAGGTHISLVCVVAAPEGVAAVEAAHPDVQIVAAALDRELNTKKYIMPGLGDFGDRLFGTEV
ncbi:MAG: uracil phosphoribosyltransferase [Armatimonas sp.]